MQNIRPKVSNLLPFFTFFVFLCRVFLPNSIFLNLGFGATFPVFPPVLQECHVDHGRTSMASQIEVSTGKMNKGPMAPGIRRIPGTKKNIICV